MTAGSTDDRRLRVRPWERLRDEHAPILDTELQVALEVWPDLLAAEPGPSARDLLGMPEVLVRRFALFGPDACVQAVAGIDGPVVRLVAGMEPEPAEDDAPYAVLPLSVLAAERCCGLRRDDAVEDCERERRWLTALARMRERPAEQHPGLAALAAAGAGLPDVAVELAGGHEVPFDPTEAYGIDLPELAAHLAGAQRAGASRRDVEEAWQSFLTEFVDQVDVDAVPWDALMWTALAVYARLDGVPEADVADRLHRELLG